MGRDELPRWAWLTLISLAAGLATLVLLAALARADEPAECREIERAVAVAQRTPQRVEIVTEHWTCSPPGRSAEVTLETWRIDGVDRQRQVRLEVGPAPDEGGGLDGQ